MAGSTAQGSPLEVMIGTLLRLSPPLERSLPGSRGALHGTARL